MNQLINNNIKLSLIQPTQTIVKYCKECRKKRRILKSHRICHICYKTIIKQKLSGNKIIDDFIKHTQINYAKTWVKLEYVPYEQFENIEFIAEGGFSKIYKATWIDGPVNYKYGTRNQNCTVVLKKLNNTKNITSKELNEVRTIFTLI